MEVTWFRPPGGDDPGTLNACYNALDIHVIRGRADDDAVSLDGSGQEPAASGAEIDFAAAFVAEHPSETRADSFFQQTGE